MNWEAIGAIGEVTGSIAVLRRLVLVNFYQQLEARRMLSLNGGRFSVV
jgi:hypothetical protein